MLMAALFERDGIRFQYPATWRLEREDTANGWTVSVQSPGTAFLLLCADHDMPDVKQVAQTVLAALREEYDDVESDDAVGTIAGQPAVGHDIRFFSFDLTNSCWTRAFQGSEATVLLMWQVNDLELEQSEPVLRAILASVQIDD
jgi:hypothetical protein